MIVNNWFYAVLCQPEMSEIILIAFSAIIYLFLFQNIVEIQFDYDTNMMVVVSHSLNMTTGMRSTVTLRYDYAYVSKPKKSHYAKSNNGNTICCYKMMTYLTIPNSL